MLVADDGLDLRWRIHRKLLHALRPAEERFRGGDVTVLDRDWRKLGRQQRVAPVEQMLLGEPYLGDCPEASPLRDVRIAAVERGSPGNRIAVTSPRGVATGRRRRLGARRQRVDGGCDQK
jgi:hypothetical protein